MHSADMVLARLSGCRNEGASRDAGSLLPPQPRQRGTRRLSSRRICHQGFMIPDDAYVGSGPYSF
jgi:hypothetical protein